jgi:hypothetical protein
MRCFNRAHDLLKVFKAYKSQVGREPFELRAVDECSSGVKDDTLISYRPYHRPGSQIYEN